MRPNHPPRSETPFPVTSPFIPRVGLLALVAALWLAGGCASDASVASTTDELPSCSSVAAPEPGTCEFETTGFYTSKEPYAPRQLPSDLDAPPPGFSVVMIQHVARHGSRALSSADDDDLVYQLWTQAREEGALTPLGERLGPVLEDILRVHGEVGYGRISRLGELEQEATAARMVERHPELFTAIVERGDRIDVLHSGRERADESGVAFVRGLTTAVPGLDALVEPGEASPATLYFNEAEGSEDYQAYSDGDARMLATVAAIEEHPNTRAMARLMLRQLFTEAFVDRLAAGEYRFAAAADPDDVLSDELDAADALYGLYSIAIGMTEEADWDFGRFMHPDAVAWFGYVDDAGSFYDRGPGFADEDISYAGARVLVEDMLDRIDGWLAGELPYPVTVRFSHAQALMPLAAFLGIEGASEGADPAVPYDYETSAWRSATASPMSANVQWDVFTNAEGVTLIRMLHQEGEVRFASECRSWGDTRHFYERSEIRRCYGF